MINTRSFHYKDLLSLLEGSIKNAEEEVLLVAPFIKHSIIEILLKSLTEGVKLTVYTRWRLDEILSGVSDIEIWELFRDSQNMSLKLSPNLHAKYYRFDNTIILGSANLTAKALIRNAGSNFEILQTSEMNDECRSFEIALANSSVKVNDELFEQVNRIVEQHDGRELPFAVNELGISYDEDHFKKEDRFKLNQWLPKTRNPENLFNYYSNNHEFLTDDQIKHAKYDLLYFPIPNGLSKKAFNETISFYLLQMPVVKNIDSFLGQERRFGEMSSYLDQIMSLKERNLDPKRVWQTLMRWLLIFFEDKYLVQNANYSEVFVKQTRI